MLFLASIFYNPTQPPRAGDSENLQPEHYKLELQLREAGQHVAGAGLYPTEYFARRVVRDDEGFVVKDGPFAESKEAIEGFFMFECADVDEAVEIAKRIPVNSRSFVEVRRVGLWHPPGPEVPSTGRL
jgi:hypothetical protein